jgi:tetratricopeptide (TPR) repeat protein
MVRRRELASIKDAAHSFRRAIQLRPDFAPAMAGLAETSSMLPPGDPELAMQLATRAVELDPECGACQGVLGFLLFSKKWNWKDSGERLDRAVRLSPDDSQLRFWRAQRLAVVGRLDAALREIEQAQVRRPQALHLEVLKAACLYFRRDYEGSVSAAGRALAVNLPAAWEWRSRALFALRRHEEALRALSYFFGSWTTLSSDELGRRQASLLARYQQSGLCAALRDLLAETAMPDAARVHALNRAV